MLLVISLSAWRHTRPKEADRAHQCVTACYSVLTVESICAITKKNGWGLNRHMCYCFNCKFTYHPKEKRHLCYMQSISVTKSQQKTSHGLIFYDFESMLLQSGTHSPNLVVAQSICEHCSRHELTCLTCGPQCALCDKWNDDDTHFDKPPLHTLRAKRSDFRGEKTR